MANPSHITRSHALTIIAATLVGVTSAQAEEAPAVNAGVAPIAAPEINPVEVATDAPPVNSGKVAFSLGFDVVTEYWFRGLGQENQGLILQPWIDVTFSLLETEDLNLTGSVGTWNSIQSATDGDAWYESDFYAGVGAEMGAFTLGASYINLYNPAGGNIFAEEIDITLAVDVTEFNLPACLSPSFTLAFEIDGGSDNGSNKGTYLEIAFEPTKEDIFGSDSMPVALAIPMKVGLGLDNYYEDGMGNDDTFGFFDVGLVLSTPLDGLIPADYGAWTASVGVHAIFLGDSAQNISSAFGTGNDDNSVYGIFSLSMAY